MNLLNIRVADSSWVGESVDKTSIGKTFVRTGFARSFAQESAQYFEPDAVNASAATRGRGVRVMPAELVDVFGPGADGRCRSSGVRVGRSRCGGRQAGPPTGAALCRCARASRDTPRFGAI
ncbi:hypothetical protein [Burkholderia sp. BDU5]|uniref:hypothetical protein n=1 Tax=Burkholderia sp. BDU5 TaxID=1385590 RepID=UPI000AFE6AD8|nr:hypothetical protein [Burkholderia sp. BDU5]